MGEKLKCFICDIDNCYTDSREWVNTVPSNTDRVEWDEFQKRIHMARPNINIIKMVDNLIADGNMHVVFITGREDRVSRDHDHRKETIEQLESFSDGILKIGDNAHLYMRHEFDYRPSDVVKESILIAAKQYYDFLFAIDDEEINCKMFARHGIPVIKYNIGEEKN